MKQGETRVLTPKQFKRKISREIDSYEQQSLSRVAGITAMTLWRMRDKGKQSNNPHMNTLVSIAEAMGYKVSINITKVSSDE